MCMWDVDCADLQRVPVVSHRSGTIYGMADDKGVASVTGIGYYLWLRKKNE